MRKTSAFRPDRLDTDVYKAKKGLIKLNTTPLSDIFVSINKAA